MKGYFYSEHGIPVPMTPIELKDDLDSSIEAARQMFDSNNAELKEKANAWALLVLDIRVPPTSSKKGITLNGRLLICD
jgi:hypothetical protein